MRVLLGCDKIVSPWVQKRLPGGVESIGPHTTMGIVRKDRLICGIIFKEYTGHDIKLDIASESPYWCSKKVLRAIFQYVFEQLECSRCTGIQPASNTPAHSLVERLGFEREGVIRLGWDGVEDAWIYGMLRSECRWIGGRIDGRQEQTEAAENA